MSHENPLYREALWELLTSKFDSKPTKNEQYAEQLMNVHAEFVKRNGKLTDLFR